MYESKQKEKNGFVDKNWREARKRSRLLLSKLASAVHRCVAPLSANQHCVTAGFLEHVLVTQSRQGENTGSKRQSHGTTLNLREIYNSKVIVSFSGKKKSFSFHRSLSRVASTLDLLSNILIFVSILWRWSVFINNNLPLLYTYVTYYWFYHTHSTLIM